MARKGNKLRNITLSADADLIAKARRQALADDMTLNEAFRIWLEQFTRPISTGDDYEQLMTELKGVLSGARFSRDEANKC